MTVTAPVQLLFEAIDMRVSVESRSGIIYEGKLASVEPTLSVIISDCTITHPTGQKETAHTIMLRGSEVRFVSVPDALMNSPVLKQGNRKI